MIETTAFGLVPTFLALFLVPAAAPFLPLLLSGL